MGNLYSSVSEEAKMFKELSEEETPITPSTPAGPPPNNEDSNAMNKKLIGLIDPRSPSQGMSRTPLEIEERNRRLEKARITNLFANKENNLSLPVAEDSVQTPTGPPKDCFSAFDPRSPNAEINRTPISYGNNPPVGRKVLQPSD